MITHTQVFLVKDEPEAGEVSGSNAADNEEDREECTLPEALPTRASEAAVLPPRSAVQAAEAAEASSKPAMTEQTQAVTALVRTAVSKGCHW